ncbi:MAG: cyclophilin-like family protein [Woeseiaceae bacterium]
MKNDYYLMAGSREYKLVLDENSGIEERLLEGAPIIGEGTNIGGEVYFITDIDIPFNGNEREIFSIGNLVYWRSQKEKKFAIAVFFGNTSHGTGTAPTAASPSIRFASITGSCAGLESIATGTQLKLFYK